MWQDESGGRNLALVHKGFDGGAIHENFHRLDLVKDRCRPGAGFDSFGSQDDRDATNVECESGTRWNVNLRPNLKQSSRRLQWQHVIGIQNVIRPCVLPMMKQLNFFYRFAKYPGAIRGAA